VAKLHFYYSAMNAGKSTILLQSSYNYHERGMETLLLAPIVDDRYGTAKIASRIGLQANAINFSPEENLYILIKSYFDNGHKLNCVLIDEAQFLKKDQVWQLTDIVDEFNIPVLAYGLRSDFRGEPFEGSLYLLTLAEDVAEIKTICHCGRKATMNIRLDEKGNVVTIGNQIEIGGNGKYVAVCRKHFKKGRMTSILG